MEQAPYQAGSYHVKALHLIFISKNFILLKGDFYLLVGILNRIYHIIKKSLRGVIH